MTYRRFYFEVLEYPKNKSDSARSLPAREGLLAESLSWERRLPHLDVTAGAEGFGVV